VDPKRFEAPHRNPAEMNLSAAPVSFQVLYDLEQCVMRYAESASALGTPAAGFARFRALWRTLRVREVFGMRQSCGRFPGWDETDEDWAEMLLRGATRHLQPAVHPGVHERTGALFLVYALYTQQPCARPHVRIPVAEAEWAGIEQLASELRAARDADGFAVLHSLRTAGAFAPVKMHDASLSEVHAVQSTREEATALVRGSGEADASCGASLAWLDLFLPRLSTLEGSYEKAWSDTAGAVGGGSTLRREHGALFGALLAAKAVGAAAHEVAARERPVGPGWASAGHLRREQKRHAGYKPTRKRRAEEVGAVAEVEGGRLLVAGQGAGEEDDLFE